MIYDTVPFHDELDILECRLTELEPISDLKHVIVEAEVTHQDKPKPSYLRDNWSRFERWHDRITHVWATDLPKLADYPDPWAREIAQREWCAAGLKDAKPGDLVLHGDVDEIPTAVAARNVKPRDRYIAFEQRGHFWSLRWLYPVPWRGTVAAEAQRVTSFGAMRDQRNTAMSLPNAGWHLSWLGGRDRAIKKVGSFCHPEVEDRIVAGLDDNRFMNDGVHVDGLRMFPVEIDRTYPRWIQEGKHPASWVELPLGTEYDRLCRIPSDIVDHLPRFYDMAVSRNVKHVIELGTRSGVSTIAWLHGLAQTGGKLTSVDIDQRPPIGDHDHWTFIQGDDCDPAVMVKLEPADIVFIDTSHLYDHTLRELNLYKRLVKPGGLMVLHDTMLEQPIGAPPSPRFPVRVAIEEFCAAEGLTWTEFKDSWGLGVIEL